MHPRSLKAIIRVIAAIIGLIGFALFLSTMGEIFKALIKRDFGSLLVCALHLAFELYLLWVAFLCCFRFSRFAVLHFCGIITVFLILIPLSPDIPTFSWIRIASLFWMIVVVSRYRRVADRLNNILFGETAPQTVGRV